MSHNERRKRKEHTKREFCKLNMVHLHQCFFQFMEVREGNIICFIQDYLILYQRNVIYQIDNYELDTNKNMLCFVEIDSEQGAVLDSVQKGCRV